LHNPSTCVDFAYSPSHVQHFDEREECLVMTPIQAILDYVSIHELGCEGNGVKLELVVDDEDGKL
jgi:hypothetical protein